MEADDGVGEAAQTIGPETIDHFTLITYWFFNSKAHFGRKATQRLTVPLHISLLISISEGVCRAELVHRPAFIIITSAVLVSY